MPSHIKHLLKLAFGSRVSEARINELLADIAVYMAGFADEFLSALKSNGVHLGHRGPSLRREAICLFCVAAKSQTFEHPERVVLVNRLIDEMKKQTGDFDHDHKRFSFTDSQGVSYSGMGKVNLLAKTMDDRLDYYLGDGDKFKVKMRLAFAAAHVLDGGTLSGKTTTELQAELLQSSGAVKGIKYPDERRDEFIATWISSALEPIQVQLDVID